MMELKERRKQTQKSHTQKIIFCVIIPALIVVLVACNKTSGKNTIHISAENNVSENNDNGIDEDKTANEKIYKGEFRYSIAGINSDIKSDYYYSDSYFENSGKNVNEHLRTMSMDLALAVTPAPSGEKNHYIVDLMTDIGFHDISCEDMLNKTTKDTIGSAISHRNINGTEVIAVAIRGDGYEAEWASNMLIGKNGDEEGFLSASNKVIDRIKKYQKEYNLKDVKIWICGYSRAGGVANLTGKYIIEHLGEFDITDDDCIYVYTFEAPNSSADDVIYDSIHNVVNVNDFIPYIPFEKWGLYSNGQKEYIGTEKIITKKSVNILKDKKQKEEEGEETKEEADKNTVRTETEKETGKNTVKSGTQKETGKNIVKSDEKDDNKDVTTNDGDESDITKESESVSLTEFLSETADWLAETIDRESGAESMSYVSKMIEIAYSKSPEELEEMIDYFKLVGQSIVKDTSKAEWTKLILSFALAGSGIRIDVAGEIADMITEHMDIVKTERGISFSEEEYEVLKESVLPLLNLLQPIISSDAPDFTHLMTIADNAYSILMAHITSVNLGLVQEEDSYFSEEITTFPIEEMTCSVFERRKDEKWQDGVNFKKSCI